MAQANHNGNGTDQAPRRRRGRPPKLAVVEQPPQQDEVPDVYDSGSFRQFLTRYEKAQSDLHESQAELRELYKAETDRGLNRAAAKIALSWHSKILNEKMTAAEAYENLDAIRTLLDWMGHDAEARDLVARMGEEASTDPAI